MHLGFLDAQGRLYDLNFRTMKRRLRGADGEWEVDPGEAIGGEVSVEAAMFVRTERPHLLLRPTSGVALATDRRIVFVAGPSVPRSEEEPITFQVSIQVPRTAVDHLMRDAGGHEVVEVLKSEIREVLEARSELTLRAEGPWFGGRTADFLLVLRPAEAAKRIVSIVGV